MNKYNGKIAIRERERERERERKSTMVQYTYFTNYTFYLYIHFRENLLLLLFNIFVPSLAYFQLLDIKDLFLMPI